MLERDESQEVKHGPFVDALLSPSVVFLTGAGISHASGIPTFRGPEPDAIWSNDVMEMATLQFFRRNPVLQWQWYLKRFDGVRSAQPNEAHHAVTRIERAIIARGNRFQLITQNIDGLHHAAGTHNLIEIHGAARKVRCSRAGCVHGAPHGSLPFDDAGFAAFRDRAKLENLPRCPSCDALLRAHVLWFDEYYDDHDDYQMTAAQESIVNASTIVFVGTSFSVGITAAALAAAGRSGARGWAIDPHLRSAPLPTITLIHQPAEQFLPLAAAELEQRS